MSEQGSLSHLSLTTPFLGGFGNGFRAVFGLFYLILGGIWAVLPHFGLYLGVFRQKMTEWIAQSVIVNRWYVGS